MAFRQTEAAAVKANSNKNLVISTLSIQYFLSKLSTVCDTKTKQEILKVLNVEENKIKKFYNNTKTTLQELIDMILINRIYLHYTDDIDRNIFKDSLQDYGICIDRVGFNYPKAAIEFINKNIASETLYRITIMVNASDISPNTRVLLLTAAHYKPAWIPQFDYNKTKISNFYHQNGNVYQVPMMQQVFSCLYKQIDHYKFLILRLKSYGMTMTIILPSIIKGINGLMESIKLNPGLLNSVRDEMILTDVRVFLPQFKIKSNLDLTNIVTENGIKELFNKNSSSLNGILKTNKTSIENLYVNKIKQSIFLDIDEFGSSRTIIPAAPPFTHPRADSDPSIVNFIVDHPFLFTINIEESALNNKAPSISYYELFSGVYYGPD